MKRDLYELHTEITGIAMVLSGLSNQLDDTVSDSLTPQALNSALFSISSYLDRIAEDLLVIDDNRAKKARAAS